MVNSINKFFSASDIIEKLWMEEVSDVEISYSYPQVVSLNQADMDLFTHKIIYLESKKDRVIKFIEKTANTTQEGYHKLLDPINQSDYSKLIYAQTVESDLSCTYFLAKTDVSMQVFEDTHSINQ